MLVPGHEKLDVSWDPPEFTGGVTITKYNVQYRLTSATSWSSAGSVSFGTAKTIMDLTNDSEYEVQVQACNSGGCGDWSESATEKAGERYAKPRNLVIVPMPDRMAQLTWEPSKNADGNTVYDVFAKKPDGTEGIPAFNISNSSRRADIDLDYVAGTSGLAEEPHFDLWVVAKDKRTTPTVKPSDTSQEIIIIDTPITVANGHSPSGGQAKLSWLNLEHQDVLDDPTYRGGTYSFRYRRLGRDHTLVGWEPKYFISHDIVEEQDLGTDNAIEGLTKGAIYAIQLRYSKEGKPDVFAARDVYVWPSDRPADDGERVASFPLNYPIAGKEYRYRFCDETFPPGDVTVDGIPIPRSSVWKKAAVHAFDQWEVATNHLVTTTPTGPSCADYSRYLSDLKSEIIVRHPNIGPGDKLTEEEVLGLRRFLNALEGITLVRERDRSWNEVRMVDVSDRNFFYQITPNVDSLATFSAFTELAKEVGVPPCIFLLPARGCAVFFASYTEGEDRIETTDIFLNQYIIGSEPPSLPGDDETTDRNDVQFNKCATSNNPAYATLVHEAGHALGIRLANDVNDFPDDQYNKAHPFTSDSRETVMSYSGLSFGCSPHPFDIMAIYAMYQPRVTP